jgi:hypothetical protein
MLEAGQQIIRLSDRKRFDIKKRYENDLSLTTYDALAHEGLEWIKLLDNEVMFFGPPDEYPASVLYQLDPAMDRRADVA